MDAVPPLLQIGSPATERVSGQCQSRPPLLRKNKSGSSRLSQLFPSSPSVVSPISPTAIVESSRRTSFPSPLVPASGSRRTSWGPTPPPPPTFSETTVYEPSASSFEQQGTSASLETASNTRSLFGRLTSLRGSSRQRGSYNRIHDEESTGGKRRLRALHEGDEPIDRSRGDSEAMQMSRIQSSDKMLSATGVMEQQRDFSEAGYAAEYERLERQLGAGMSSIAERPFTHSPAPIAPGTYQRQPHGELIESSSTIQARSAQEEAEKTGDIVAVAEITVDISESFGSDFETRSMVAHSTRSSKDETQKSYFFPRGLLPKNKFCSTSHANIP